MTNRIRIVFYILFCPSLLLGQNLIPNPSFEDTIPAQFGLKFAKHWRNPTKSSPDYYTVYHNDVHPNFGVPYSVTGFQNPRTGGAFMGLEIYSLFSNNFTKLVRDYVQAKLVKDLIKDSTYCIQIYISLADSIHFGSRNQLGIHFYDTRISSDSMFRLRYQPQLVVSPTKYITEKKEWLAFNLKYTAIGGERFITIGNFNDTTKVDTTYVGGGNEFWHKGTYYYLDDIYLGHCDSVPLDSPNTIREYTLAKQLNAYPNPVREVFYLESSANQKLNFQLYNLMGQEVSIHTSTHTSTPLSVTAQEDISVGNRYEFSLGHLPKGIYLLNVIGREGRATIKLVKE